MEDIRKKANKIRVILILVLIGCFLYLGASFTYTAYETFIEGNAKSNVAGIKLKINDVDVVATNGSIDPTILLESATWTSTHTAERKLSPGSTGTITMELDPTGSEVAIIYSFEFVDKTIDSTKLLTFDSITSDHTFTRTAVDEYTGLITLADLTNEDTINITINFHFDATADMEAIEEDTQVLDDLFTIQFHALQYQGETIVPYSG